MADVDPKIFTLSAGSSNESTFDVALRGYDRRQVERFVAQVESQLVALATHRDEALAQVHGLATQVQQLSTEMAELRRRTVADRPSYSHLGARAEQILTLVEEEAAAIKKRAEIEVAARHAELDRTES